MPPRRSASRFKRIAFVASDTPPAQKARQQLVRRYGDAPPETADVIVALGGDGLMLATLQRLMNSRKLIYGMHRGTVGFLMNEFSERNLLERLAAAQVTVLHPLLMRARTPPGAYTVTTPSMKSRCSARAIRRRDCAFSSTARNGSRS